ncbi:hypothetical protein L4D76_11520 [Photobacterium sagamiensis]
MSEITAEVTAWRLSAFSEHMETKPARCPKQTTITSQTKSSDHFAMY